MTNWRALSPLEVIRGGQFRKALFLTYTLSLGFFEGLILPPLRRGGVRDTRIISDVSGVAAALGESGAREVGRAYAVHPVKVEGGVFHSKLAFLDGEHLHVLLGSGNLTFGGYGTNLEVLEHLVPDRHSACFADLAEFVGELLTSNRVTLPERDELGGWFDRLSRIERRSGDERVRVLHNLRDPIGEQLVQHAASLGGALRLSIVSPYFGSTAAVSRLAEELSVAEVACHVPCRLPLHGETFAYEQLPGSEAVVMAPMEQAVQTPRPEHLKVIEVECADGTLLLSGSVNASGPALWSKKGNVETAVLRILRGQTSLLPRRAHTGALPLASEGTAESNAGVDTLVLQASLVAGRIQGAILADVIEGEWQARLEAGSTRLDVNEVQVGAGGAFTLENPALSALTLAGGRAVLTLMRGGRRARGFVNFTEMLGLTRRIGASVGPLLRLAEGAGDDGDLVAALEWFAMNPDATVGPWRAASSRGERPTRPEEALSVGLFAVGEADDDLGSSRGDGSSDLTSSGSHASALDRLLTRLRSALRTPSPAPEGSAGQTERIEREDLDADEPAASSADPGLTALDKLWAVLSERVAAAPGAELARMIEIAAHVLTRRRAPAERTRWYASDWTDQAVRHLAVAQLEEEWRSNVLALVCLTGELTGNYSQARRRALHFLGSALRLEAALKAALSGCSLSIRALCDSSAGPQLNQSVDRILRERSAYDDIIALVGALEDRSPLPNTAVLTGRASLDLLRRHVEKGRFNKVKVVSEPVAACPHHHRLLPSGAFYDLQSIGLATAGCCDLVIVSRRP